MPSDYSKLQSNLLITNTDIAKYQLYRTKYKLWLVTLHFSDTYSFYNETKTARAACGVGYSEEIFGLREALNLIASLKKQNIENGR